MTSKKYAGDYVVPTLSGPEPVWTQIPCPPTPGVNTIGKKLVHVGVPSTARKAWKLLEVAKSKITRLGNIYQGGAETKEEAVITDTMNKLIAGALEGELDME